MNDELFDPRDLNIEQIKDFFTQKGYTSYRASQLFAHLHKYRKTDMDSITNFSRELRNLCKKWFYFRKIEHISIYESADFTRKFLFKLHDGKHIESVLIFNNEKWTACISSQVGCRYACTFCRTAGMKFDRNLYPSEIVEQYSVLKSHLLTTSNQKVTNLVFMGMGEPLDNYENVLNSISILSQSGGHEISKKRMTLSTCGHIDGIHQLCHDKRSPQLAISLNTASQEKREKIMPCAKIWKIDDLLKIAMDFSMRKKERVTLEYIMIKDFNDSMKDADLLLNKIRNKGCFKVNLIPLNAGDHIDLKPSDPDQILRFQTHLKSNKLSAHIRHTKGDDILAACGQLAGRPDLPVYYET